MNNLADAYEIARSADVSSAPNTVVLYSISYLPTDENKIKAQEYLKKHKNYLTLDSTECGKLLLSLGMETNFKAPEAELMRIWAIASERFINAASGNIIAFVKNADKRSTFCKIELPGIIKNDKILTVNNINKFVFIKQFNFSPL